jgi:riboflavin synthase
MFTGIITERGVVTGWEASATDATIEIRQPAAAGRLAVGGSVAVDGVCQTVVARHDERFVVRAMTETLRVTTLGERRVGDPVNLETPVTAGQPLGGHYVQGHVDGLAEIVSHRPAGDAELYRFRATVDLVAALVPKGSVAVDGISLTVGPRLGDDTFEVYLIPHTLEVTTLGAKGPGDRVNLELDILAKTVRRFLEAPGRAAAFDWEDLRTAALESLEGAARD